MADEMNAAERLEDSRALARSFRQHLPESERRLYDELLGKAGPLIRATAQDPVLEPRDAFLLSLLGQALMMIGELREEVEKLRGDGT